MKFFDFCSGIGTARMALESLAGSCVGHAEIDAKAVETYQLFFGNEEKNWGDLMEIDPRQLPEFDLMVAGFPCQTFSIAGKRDGMNDHRGQIIHGLCRILKDKNTAHFLLENVKGLLNHDSGRTLKEVLQLLDEAGYIVDYKVLKSNDYGIPQIRERIFLLGTRKDLVEPSFQHSFPEKIESHCDLTHYLTDDDPSQRFDLSSKAGVTFLSYLKNSYNHAKFDLVALLKQNNLVLDTRQSDLRLYKSVIPTLRTARHGILYVRNGSLRRLSGYEALLLQGVPLELAQKAQHLNNTTLLSQAGNAMTVNVIQQIGLTLLNQRV